jgi:hypothetical protein
MFLVIVCKEKKQIIYTVWASQNTSTGERKVHIFNVKKINSTM